MGTLAYDITTVHFEDRLLTHLQIVIVQKFARGESFLMSWRDNPSIGDGRAAIWLSPHTPLYFKFQSGRVPDINRDWLIRLGTTADSSTGLIVLDEDGQVAESENDERYPGTF